MQTSSTPSSTRASLLGCGLAFVWLVLMVLQMLAEPRLRIAERANTVGISTGWLEVALGSLLFALMLGVTLLLLPRYRERQPLTRLLVGWVGGGVAWFLLLMLWLARYGGIVVVGAG